MIDPKVDAINRTIPADAWAYRYRARLVALHDGDTARVDIDLGFTVEMKNVQIRFDGYNAPEVTGPQKPQGVAARNYLAQMIADSDNTLYLQTQQVVIMSITRYVASVYLKSAAGPLYAVADAMKYAGYDVPRAKTKGLKPVMDGWIKHFQEGNKAPMSIVDELVEHYVNWEPGNAPG
jgi:hypothetical protein